jgi:hypothetical protein
LTTLGWIRYDLRSDQAQVIWEGSVERPAWNADPKRTAEGALTPLYTRPTYRMGEQPQFISQPIAEHGGYLWYMWGRTSIDGKRFERFPSPRGEGTLFFGEVLQFIDGGNQLLVADQRGMWLLTFPDLNRDSGR